MPRHRAIGGNIVVLCLMLGVAGGTGCHHHVRDHAPVTLDLELLGMAVYPGNREIAGAPIGGLSGLAWDAATETWLAVSDDAAVRGPARVYRLAIDLDDGRLEEDAVKVVEMIELRDADGGPFAPHTIDPEGIAILPNGTFYASSEGNADEGIPPFVRRFAADGSPLEELSLPSHLAPDGDGRRGIRQNTGLEALGLTPDNRWLFTAVESALAQDGLANDPKHDSPARLLRFVQSTGELASEHVYVVDPLPARPEPPDGVAVKGITELLPLTENHLLVLERTYVEGHGNTVELYLATFPDATNVSGIPDLTPGGHRSPSGEWSGRREAVQPVSKRLLLDFATLGVPVDNLEGMAFGPDLPDGRRLLLVVSDNNFNADTQITQFLAFAL